MTKRQFKICQNVVKYKNLRTVLVKTKISDYNEIQEILGPNSLDFDDINNDDTDVFLSNYFLEEFERYREKMFDVWFNRILAIWGAITGTIAVVAEIMLHFL